MASRLLCAARAAGTLAALCVTACGNDKPRVAESRPPCLDSVDLPCALRHSPPTFHQIFTETLRRTCAGGGSSCHSPSGRKGGLFYADPATDPNAEDDAYALLLGNSGARARVKPGDARCSELVVRLDAPESAAWHMPPGSPQAAGERCDIRQWIQDGAARGAADAGTP